MTVLLDTELAPESDRADVLHAFYENETPRRRVFIDGYPIRHRAERINLGPNIQVLRTGGSAVHILRTPREVRQDSPEYVAIGPRRRGAGLISAGDTETSLPVGHLNCVDMTSPYRLLHTSAHVHDVLILSNAAASVGVDLVRSARYELRRSPVYDLMATHLEALFTAARALAPSMQLVTGQATVALVRALLTTAAASGDGREALETSLEARIEMFVDTHLAERDLTAQRIAAAHHISVRHLYNVWARAGHSETPAQWIAKRRLQRARQQLAADPAASIAAIARANGFPDSSHFSRRFRSVFGASPRDWQATQRARAGNLAVPTRQPSLSTRRA